MGYSDVNQNPVVPGDNVPVTTSISASATVGAAANNQTLAPPNAINLVYCTGFVLSGLGATAASAVAVTLTGLTGGTLNFSLPVPAGVLAGVLPLVVIFNRPMAATGKNVSVVLNVPTYGAGNTTATATLLGFYI